MHSTFPVMVSERRNGNLLVHLGAKLQAYPEELIRQRRGHDGHTEYLIRWSILSLEEGTGSSTNASSTESKTENILMWMSAEEVYANCPTLLGKRKPEGQRVKEEKAPSTFPSDVTLDEASLLEMKEDVRSLVQRAGRQMARAMGPASSILNTIHVLSAYASIGSLTGVFKETGALDLLMKMLCNEEKQIRRSAGKMLRALASHDAGSRAYVLLSLSQQDGIEQHMDFDSRYTLLELFAETTSSEEHCMSFEGIHLPQIPGKLLFSLVKRYLCVTSLMDKVNSSTELGAERQDCAAHSTHFGERTRVQREFEFSMAMANLISELVRVMGWDCSQKIERLSLWEARPRVIRSIFQPKAPACTPIQVAPGPPQKEASAFKTRSAFPSRSSYAEYVQATLTRGMWVRMLEDYEQVNAGDEGEFRQSNDGMPPVQLSELGEEALTQLSVPVELAQKVLQVLSKQCQGSTLSDLHSSHVYIKYFLSKGWVEQDSVGVDAVPSESAGHGSAFLEAMVSKKPKTDLPTADVPSPAPATVEKSDSQLFNELFKAEGLVLPELLEEKAKVLCSVKGSGKKSSLEKIADALEMIQRSSSEVELQVAGLRFIIKTLEEELGRERHLIKIESGLTIREKLVKMLVELLTNQVKEKLLVVLALRLLCVLMAKYDWRVLFATEGGVRAVLTCMQEYGPSALVQQAGLTALKVLVGAGNCEVLGTSGKPYPLNHSDAQMMREIFASIGSATSKDSDSLLCAILAVFHSGCHQHHAGHGW
ncbi:cullin-9-like isoform X4 [Alligator sinensis]|uniref:Cullin-9-like isoform X4 n=1 Tax=Alligator sinensis TaxID=38654 RepID=A0A3Q0FKW6_ALLSI|nr:cullin-9-like isoform X4 [Alligator sinensis]